jgi:hypothetical protein
MDVLSLRVIRISVSKVSTSSGGKHVPEPFFIFAESVLVLLLASDVFWVSDKARSNACQRLPTLPSVRVPPG